MEPPRLSDEDYADAIARRRAFKLPGYTTLGEVGFDGEWVTPLQMCAGSRTGPVLIAFNWLDADAVRTHETTLRAYGYLPSIPFNVVLDKALALRGLERSDVYLTQAFHLLPDRRSGSIPVADIQASFEAVTRHEIAGRPVMALGAAAASACRAAGLTHTEVPHPSARGLSYDARAALIADALAKIGY